MSDVRLKATRIEVQLAVASSPNAVTPQAATPESKMIVLPLIVMAISVFVGSSIGPMFKWIMVRMHLSATLSAVWRNQCIILLLIPPTLIEWARAEPVERAIWWSPVKESEAATAATHHVVLYVAFIAVVWAANLYLYVKSLEFTSTVRTTLFANTQPLILMAYFSVVKGVRHSLGEQVGVVLAIAGIGMALLDDSGAAAQQVGRSPFVGDLMGLGVAFLMSVNIVVIGRVRKTVPLFVYTLSSITGMTVVLAFAAVAFEGAHFGGGDAGVWGFVEPEHARFFLFIGFLNGCFGMLSRNFCIKHIPPVVFSIFALLGPVITGWMVFFVGLEGIPQTWTLIGGCAVLLGISLVIYFEHHRSEQLKLDAAAAAAEASAAAAAREASLADDLRDFALHDMSFPLQSNTAQLSATYA